jgi:hypothetical protein
MGAQRGERPRRGPRVIARRDPPRNLGAGRGICYSMTVFSRLRRCLHEHACAAGVLLLISLCGIVVPQRGVAAPEVTVHIDAASLLGPSTVEDFLGATGLSPAAYRRRDPVIKAWNDAGMRHLRGLANTYYIKVSRAPGGRLKYDFSLFDGDLSMGLRLLKLSVGPDTLDIAIYGTPRLLSPRPRSKHYAEYAPARWREWKAYIRNVATHVVTKWAITGARYELWNEPEDKKFYWKGYPGDDDRQRLARYVRLYVATHRALTSVDPSAQLLAPASANANSAGFGAPWGLAEFVYAVATFNERHPNNPVPIRNLDWHEYGWPPIDSGLTAGQDFSVGIDFVDSVVSAVGVGSSTFPAWPRYYITEYSDGLEPLPNLQRAAYAARNMIRELHPATRRLAHIYLYTFHGDYGLPGVAAYATHRDGRACRRPLFALLEMMSAITTGDYAAASAPAPLATIATVDDASSVTGVVTNYSPEFVDAEMTFTNLPFATSIVNRNLKLIDENHSNDCGGLEQGATEQLNAEGAAVTTGVTLGPYATAQITLTP